MLINEEDQSCQSKKRQVWPINSELFEITSTMRTPLTTTLKSLAVKTPKPETLGVSCGKIKKVQYFDNFLSLPSIGAFPWMVVIYRFFGDEEEPYYKCAGTIINGLTILTSANCLLEDGLLLSADDFQVHVCPFSLSAKIQKIKLYYIAALSVHEYFNFQLEHNIAMMKLTKNIKFNDYVQPICLPERSDLSIGKLGKVIKVFLG